MKTEITYPNGLNIVIEHPDLLDAVESKETIDAIAVLTAENNALKFEVGKAEETSGQRLHTINELRQAYGIVERNFILLQERENKLYEENDTLKQQVSNLKSYIERLNSQPGEFEFKGQGGVSKQYTGTIDQITPLKSVTPIKKQREYRSKNCTKCGNSFIPTSARGNVCNNCKTETIAPTEPKDLPE